MQNERHVIAAIDAMQLARVVVAHRPETIAMAHRVVQMAAGHVVADKRRSSLQA